MYKESGSIGLDVTKSSITSAPTVLDSSAIADRYPCLIENKNNLIEIYKVIFNGSFS
jgi:hypothetical protein